MRPECVPTPADAAPRELAEDFEAFAPFAAETGAGTRAAPLFQTLMQLHRSAERAMGS